MALERLIRSISAFLISALRSKIRGKPGLYLSVSQRCWLLVSLCFWLVPASTNVQAMTSPGRCAGFISACVIYARGAGWVSTACGIFETEISRTHLWNPADCGIRYFATESSGGRNHKANGKGHCGGLLQLSLGNFATTDFTLVLCINSYLAAPGLSHSR